jgi:hypothetical protein
VKAPLRYKHLQPDLGEVVAGSPTAVPAAGDSQGDVNSLAMQTGDAVNLGPADLDGIYAVFLRSSGSLNFELHAGKVAGPLLASDSAGHARPDYLVGPRGMADKTYISVTSKLKTPGSVKGPTDLILVVTSGAGAINYVDLTGSGAMAPYRFPTPLKESVELFNGRDLKDWKQIGPGTFSVDKDRSILALAPDSGWGWLYNAKKTYTNFVLRIDVKEDGFGANGGVMIRHSDNEDNNYTSFTGEEIQVTDVNTEYLGGIDHVDTAFRQPQSSPNEWSSMEIVANGPRIQVWVNGVKTADGDETTGCSLFGLPCNGGAYGGYGTGGSGYISVEAELGHVWYRNIEIHDCGVTDDAFQTSDDPLCNP